MEKMVKFFLISFIFFCCFHFTLALCPITPCCGHGHIEKTNLCVCMSTWTGINCDTQGKEL